MAAFPPFNLMIVRVAMMISWICSIIPGLAQDIVKGQVTDTMVCLADPRQSYALYVPSYYDPAKQWPAIFIFEPAARGPLPVKRFQQAAERLGYIVLGSNNSRNGSWELAFEAGNAMLADAFSRFTINPKQLYTSGFSGGSRVASAVAALTGKIAGVIACGAGFSNTAEYRIPEKSPVHYVALVGDQDMNYQEHRLLEGSLNDQGIVNTRIIFNAGHQWPDADHLEEALNWLELAKLKHGIKNDRFDINQAFKQAKERADSILAAGDYTLAHYTYGELIQAFDGLVEIKPVVEILKQIEGDKAYRKQHKQIQKLDEKELSERQLVGEAFTELYFTKLKSSDSTMKKMEWWEARIDLYKRWAQKEDVATRNMGLRMLNVISARCAESAENMVDQGDYETALALTRIWLYSEPSTWCKWNMALILAYMNDPLFFDYLQEVVSEATLLTPSRIYREEAFEAYRDHPQMQHIVSQLQ